MKKRTKIAFLLTVFMVLTLIASGTASAALDASAKLTVDGTELVTGGATTTNTVTGAVYNLAANTLTLDGYNGGAIKASEMDLNLVLRNENTVTGSESWGVIQARSDSNPTRLTISAPVSGSLNVHSTASSGRAYGVYGSAGVDIQDAAVYVNMDSADNTYGIGTSGAPINIDVSSGTAAVISTVAGGTMAAHALVGSAVNITGDVLIKEGDDAASARTVSGLTLTPDGAAQASKKYVAIHWSGLVSDPDPAHMITCGEVYTGEISIKDGDTVIGTFDYVYSPGLYINDYIMAGMKIHLDSPYSTLLSPDVDAELALRSWYSNYKTTGSVTVDPAAAAIKSNWASVDLIIANILKRSVQSPTPDDVDRSITFEYKVSNRNAYDVVDGQLVKSPNTGVENVRYIIYSSAAELSANASLTVDGTALVTGGATTGATVTGASYDLAANTLTLDGYTNGGINARDMDLHLILSGDNTVTDSKEMSVVEVFSGKMTIGGSGTLNVNSTKTSGTAYGVFGQAGVDIQSGTVNVNVAAAGYSYGIGTDRAPVSVDISNGAKVTSSVAGGTTAAHALVGSAVDITGSATIMEGDDAASAQTVSAVTLTTIDVGEASKKYVSISPAGGPSGPTDDPGDPTGDPETTDGIGCNAAPGLFGLLVLGLFAARRRKR